MAFTQEELTKICKYVGFTTDYLREGSIYFSTFIHKRLVGEVQQSQEDEARRILTRIDTIETALDDSVNRFKVSSVPGVQINSTEWQMLKAEKRRLIKDMVIVLSLVEAVDAYI